MSAHTHCVLLDLPPRHPLLPVRSPCNPSAPLAAQSSHCVLLDPPPARPVLASQAYPRWACSLSLQRCCASTIRPACDHMAHLRPFGPPLTPLRCLHAASICAAHGVRSARAARTAGPPALPAAPASDHRARLFAQLIASSQQMHAIRTKLPQMTSTHSHQVNTRPHSRRTAAEDSSPFSASTSKPKAKTLKGMPRPEHQHSVWLGSRGVRKPLEMARRRRLPRRVSLFQRPVEQRPPPPLAQPVVRPLPLRSLGG
eukprot:361073-Chlamydomonas_euryale.AAC.2